MICTVYSVLPNSWLILFFGLIYFVIGSFTYKYQLLYAMDHREHSTGKAWSIICIRIIIGLIFFQVAMAGVLALRTAIKRSILIIPLLVGTIWFTVFFQRSYVPLMEFIALRSLKGEGAPGVDLRTSRYDSETAGGRDVDESEETGLRYMNPSLTIPLEDMWVSKRRRNGTDRSDDGEVEDGL
jgi:calcium permeable stress-gated cation channel